MASHDPGKDEVPAAVASMNVAASADDSTAATVKRAPPEEDAPKDSSASKRMRPALLTESPLEETRPHSPLARDESTIPPAPPSTPASVMDTTHSQSIDSLPGIVENASALEEMMTVATPATPALPTKSTRAHASTKDDGDFSEWRVGDRYQMLRMLGRGSYGHVAQARDLSTGDFVAIKRITQAFDQEVDAIRLYREIHILRGLRGHECIIQLLHVVQPQEDDLTDLYLIFEYVDTDLYKLIMSPQYLTTEHIQTFLYQMLAGLNFLHSSLVIHRDLKPANILLNEDCSLKICDFGLARIVSPSTMNSSGGEEVGPNGDSDDSDTPVAFGSPPVRGLTRQLTKHVVTRWYRAPELILIQPYTSAVDIWSMGCILAELLSMQEGSVPGYQDRSPLFPGGSCYPLSGEGASIKRDERLDQLNVIFGVIGTPSQEDIESIGTANEYIKTLGIKKGKPFETLFPAADPAALDLLKKMLKFNPKQRCTAQEALEHDFLKGVRRKEMERRADQPLVGPDFLETNHVDMETLKRQTLEELQWYRTHVDAPT